MRHNTFYYNRIMLIMLAISMLLLFIACSSPAALSDPESTPHVSVDADAFTCEDAAELIEANADGYFECDPSKTDILGDADPAAELTHMSGVQMLFRAFGKLPEVESGIRYLVKYRDCAFTDVPPDGEEAVASLTQAGLYIPEDNTKFLPNEKMTQEELAVLIDRIQAYLQTNPKDDFYSCATAESLNDPELFPFDYNTVFVKTTDSNQELAAAWINSIFEDAVRTQDTKAKVNIAAYLSTYMDSEDRENSMQYFAPYLDAIWNAKDFSELTDACARVSRDIGVEVLFTEVDFSRCRYYSYDDEGSFVLSLDQDILFPGVDPDSYLEGGYDYQRNMEQKTKMLIQIGFDEDEAPEIARQYNAFYYDKYALINTGKFEIGEKTLELDELPEEITSFPLADYLENAGYEGINKINVTEYASVAAFLSLLQDEKYLDAAKCEVTCRFLNNMIEVLPAKIADAAMGMWDDYYAADERLYMQLETTQFSLLPRIQLEICEIYRNNTEYAAMEKKVNALFDDCIAVYKKMLGGEDWLGEETKKAAIEKLDAMDIAMLMPDDTSNMLTVEYKSREEGGTLFENTARYFKANRAWYIANLEETFDRTMYWQTTNMWVSNAYYIPTLNDICMPIGYFLCKEYNDSMSRETELAQIGTMMAHEITHAFDSSGSRFDKNGAENDWWTRRDEDAFQARIGAVEEYFDGYEYFPGFSKTGEQVRDESIADMGGMKCVLEIASATADFDYNEFFVEFARHWVISTTRLGCEQEVAYEEHGIGRARVNRLISLFEEFYDTYGIKEGDAMYVAPEDRPVVW